MRFLRDRVAKRSNPHELGVRLQNSGGLFRYRVGDYRIIAEIRRAELIIYVVDVGHRRDIYDR
jgi:mRNA interferase RelE/StbE